MLKRFGEMLEDDLGEDVPFMQQNNRILIVDDNRAIHADFNRILTASPIAELDQAAAELFGDRSMATATQSYELSFATNGNEGVDAVTSAVGENRPFAI